MPGAAVPGDDLVVSLLACHVSPVSQLSATVWPDPRP
jgi:hypothetical protein